MSKAAIKRKKNRQQYLKKLSVKNIQKFHFEWSKRLESWVREAEICARYISKKDNITVSSVFEYVDLALNELGACGEVALELEAEKTQETMMDACSKAVAKAVDHRIYRVSNAHSNHKLMLQGSHRPR